jgi:hypothetical protein
MDPPRGLVALLLDTGRPSCGGKTRRSDASRACIRSSVWVTAARRRNCPPWHTRSMECAHCGHAGPVHATALDPQASPRVFCDDCRSCGLLADQAGLPVGKFRRSHLQLLRVLSALTNAGASEWVGRDALTGGHSQRRESSSAPFDQLDPVVRDLGDWKQVTRNPGIALPVADSNSPARTYDGNWFARLTAEGARTVETLSQVR